MSRALVQPAMPTVTVYSRDDCPLCDEALADVRAVAADVSVAVAVEVVDVDADPDRREAYGDRVPYGFVDGRPAFKIRVDRDRLRERLVAAAAD